MQAERGMQELLESVDTVIVIPNEKLLAVAKDAGFFESFRIADDVLRQGVQGISDIITIPGVINRDFADVKTTMAGMGYAVMGTGVRTGANRAVEAAIAAMASPLLEAGAIDGARGILINITGSSSLKLSEVNEASTLIQNAAHEDANIIFGAVQDETMGDEVKITVIATGFKQHEMPQRRERMLGEATLPTVRYDVPIQPRVVTPPPIPRFASEMEPKQLNATMGEMKAAGVRVDSQTELIPVPASVFDDDFFQGKSSREDLALGADEMAREMPVRYSDAAHLSASELVQREDTRSVVEESAVVESSVRASSFGGAMSATADLGEPDELDIPAFLRRGK
jgi:cell division protein FtsZ